MERIRKINSLIRQHISLLISRHVDFKPGVFVTIPKVDTSADLRYTRISVSIYPSKESHYAMETLKKEKYTLQKELHKLLHMKPLPRITFYEDTTEAEADEIEKILIDIHNE